MLNDVYIALKNRATSGQYVAAELVAKIDALWAEDKISDAQRTELTGLTVTCVDPNYSPMTETEKSQAERILSLENAMLDVGNILSSLLTGGTL